MTYKDVLKGIVHPKMKILSSIEINGYQKLFGYQNIFFCVHQNKNKKNHTEQLEDE